LDDLKQLRSGHRPSNDALALLIELTRVSIGIRDSHRLLSLRLEQTQLIMELCLLQEHCEKLDQEIACIVDYAREGRILISCSVGATNGAVLIAMIGNIANFASPAHLRAYCGWAPLQNSSGISLDNTKLTAGSNRLLKRVVYLIVWNLISEDSKWRELDQRLLPIKCAYDSRLKTYRGKNKVIGRVAGQFLGVVYSLLRRDYDMLNTLEPGAEVPEPMLYDRALHCAHRAGHRTPVPAVESTVISSSING